MDKIIRMNLFSFRKRLQVLFEDESSRGRLLNDTDELKPRCFIFGVELLIQ